MSGYKFEEGGKQRKNIQVKKKIVRNICAKPKKKKRFLCFFFLFFSWKDRDFDWFIPLFINRSHGKYALPLAEHYILKLLNSHELNKKYNSLNGELILTALAKIMNTTVIFPIHLKKILSENPKG